MARKYHGQNFMSFCRRREKPGKKINVSVTMLELINSRSEYSVWSKQHANAGSSHSAPKSVGAKRQFQLLPVTAAACCRYHLTGTGMVSY